MVYAWPDAKIGAMKAVDAAKLIAGDGDVATVKAQFDDINNNVNAACGRGYVDSVIEPEDTRKYLICAFEILYSKIDANPEKKNGTI